MSLLTFPFLIILVYARLLFSPIKGHFMLTLGENNIVIYQMS